MFFNCNIAVLTTFNAFLAILLTAEFSCLAVRFYLQRRFEYYILRDYTVSSFIVIIAWMSFWIHRDAVPARITLGVTSLLTMTTQLGNSSTGTAIVSYLKAIDIWNTFCMVMVFVALMEYAVVNVLSHREAAAKAEARVSRESRICSTTAMHSTSSCVKEIVSYPFAVSIKQFTQNVPVATIYLYYFIFQEETSSDRPQEKCTRCHRSSCLLLPSGPEAVDKFARVLYPVIFIVFNIVYWDVFLWS